MIGLDTNILVRYFAQDDFLQSRRATEIIEQDLTISNPGFVSLVTMAETAWVLDHSYGMSRRETIETVERMLQANTLIVQNEQEVFTALTALDNEIGSFADALIGALGNWAGCTKTLTFDRRASKLPNFQLA